MTNNSNKFLLLFISLLLLLLLASTTTTAKDDLESYDLDDDDEDDDEEVGKGVVGGKPASSTESFDSEEEEISYNNNNNNIQRTATTLPTFDDNDDDDENDDSFVCGLYLAESLIPGEGFGLFTGKNLKRGDVIGEPELFIPLLDKYKTLPYRGQQRWLSWLNYVRGTTQFHLPKNIPLSKMGMGRQELKRSATGPQFMDGIYRIDAVAPGIASMAVQHPGLTNLQFEEYNTMGGGKDDTTTSTKVKFHRDVDPAAGAMPLHYGHNFMARQDIMAGSELYIMPTDEEIAERRSFRPARTDVPPPPTLEWLKRTGTCLDNLKVDISNIPQAGRGAFAKRAMKKGSLIAPSPLAVLKREDLVMYEVLNEVEVAEKFSHVLNKDKVVGTELLMNYVYGHPDSDIFLLPLSPVVNFINHNGTAPNAEIRWPKSQEFTDKWLKAHPLELLDMSGTPFFEIIALRDIEPNEEVVIDYGDEWDEAWQIHLDEWEEDSSSSRRVFQTAMEYMRSPLWSIRTIEEQKHEPYPKHMQTICRFPTKSREGSVDKIDCWLPCEILFRLHVKGTTYYKAEFTMEQHGEAARRMASYVDQCIPPRGRRATRAIPHSYIGLVDKYGTSDIFLPEAFRHEIGVPSSSFYPDLWMESTVYDITPLHKPLRPGEFVPITWAHNGKPVTRNAYFVGLPPNFHSNMREYAERVGAMDHFRDILVNGNYNDPGDERVVQMKEAQYGNWYIQRPLWNSNMHWIIPWNEVARKSYLRQLGKVGFDAVLDSVGTAFGMKKLTCFHNTFLGISESDDSNMHTDFYETQRSSFDFLLPIIMAENSTKPELDLQSIDGNVLVGIKYRYGVAVSLGDHTYHKSAMVNYLGEQEFRVVSSVYCSDITEDNRDSLLYMYGQEDPAPFKRLFDLPVKEWHWDLNGMTFPKEERRRR